jgi:hypothetical protein
VIKLASRRAAIVLAGSALTLAVGMLPAQAATSGWRTNATVVAARGNATLFYGVGASSQSDAWTAGFSAKTKGASSLQPVIRHWTGKAWRAVTLPAKTAKAWAKQTPIITQVGVSSARSVWVFNSLQGSYLRLDGSRWSLGQLPGASEKSGALLLITAVKVFSGTDVWAFGLRSTLSGTQSPYAARYNGSKWSTVTVPALTSGGGGISAVAAVSANDIWAVESSTSSSTPPAASDPAIARAVAASPAAKLAVARLRHAASATAAPVVLQWTPSAGWQQPTVQPSFAATDQLTSGIAEPNGDVWFGGSADNSAGGTSPLAVEGNGTTWSAPNVLGKASSAQLEVTDMAPDGTGGVWALAANATTETERIWHLHGTSWSQAKTAFGKHPWLLETIALVPRTQSVWGVGTVEGSSKKSANGLIAIEGSLPR